MAQKNLGIDMIIDYVIGILNGFADAVSRGVPSTTLDTHFKKDFLTNKAAFCLFTGQSISETGRFAALSAQSRSHVTH